ncbi:MAG: hypothetical protein ACKVJG_21485 [Candidatus Latescibacterota bacterium]
MPPTASRASTARAPIATSFQRHGCPLEIILKDISTGCYQPQRLWQWADIPMDLAKGQVQAQPCRSSIGNR